MSDKEKLDTLLEIIMSKSEGLLDIETKGFTEDSVFEYVQVMTIKEILEEFQEKVEN